MSDSYDLYQRARQAMDNNKLEEAIELFQHSIMIEPHFKSLELLGECLIRLKRYREAIVPLAAATILNKGVRAPTLLAKVFLNLKDYSKAREVAELALTRDTNNKEARRVIESVAERTESA